MRKFIKVTLSILGVLAALIVVVAIATGGKTHTAAQTAPLPVPSHSAPASPAPATSAPAAPATPAGPTVSQQQALDDAQGYLSGGSGFSRQGLIGQLEYDKFSTADATYAADHSGADWNAQAVEDAKGYMSGGSGFSRDGLISQLQYDKFTYAQAVYAAGQVGL